jgi:diaminohydroxyphosphoribosylaminopyrimidine deaminase/5-amino-6-(5-phosphoribosylamino)uracil reductase
VTDSASQPVRDRAMLDLAARAARRAQGMAEPNPLVGCVLADANGRVLAVGHHTRFGGPHAEIEAIRAARARGVDPRGATAFVTLEPCNHQGKTPPCAAALIEAGITEVVIARPDPNPIAMGGADALRAAGVAVRFTDASPNAVRLTDPFVRRVETGLPWVIAKWAQSIDGRIATRTGDSKWISNERSRALVHRWRSRVDAVLTGIGTVLADDPRLDARIGLSPRRTALRAVVDAALRTPTTSNLARTANELPVVIFCAEDHADSQRARGLHSAGVEVVPVPRQAGAAGSGAAQPLDLTHALRWLAVERGASNVLVEAGPGLVGSLARQGLIDECRVFVAPFLMGDPAALPAADVGALTRIADARRFTAERPRRVGDDALLVFRTKR